ncbi:hypothetical protein FLAG1_00965 [Fusarium langsethiae]|uniref:Uncharacterized protein n=1 Tax=Fusarium langsethiae TaxID=179993 RepID=A0A0M9F4S9_FUSLA|nr:hypothetical protein FLAG1_00965 [Fusarium langsethiae]GKT98242.1 unnamed protein product [Fusarium langsethiae]GKU12808.1 unnamed protein product [Fusarium langsethiae]
MSSTAPQQGSAVGTTEGTNGAEPQCMSLDRVAGYSPDNIIASISSRNRDATEPHDQGIASLEVNMAGYRNTAQDVNPPSLLAGTGSKFK